MPASVMYPALPLSLPLITNIHVCLIEKVFRALGKQHVDRVRFQRSERHGASLRHCPWQRRCEKCQNMVVSIGLVLSFLSFCLCVVFIPGKIPHRWIYDKRNRVKPLLSPPTPINTVNFYLHCRSLTREHFVRRLVSISMVYAYST